MSTGQVWTGQGTFGHSSGFRFAMDKPLGPDPAEIAAWNERVELAKELKRAAKRDPARKAAIKEQRAIGRAVEKPSPAPVRKGGRL